MRKLETLQGQFLIAMPGMGDTRFEKTVVYLCAHSSDGAMGFIVNRTIDKPSFPDFLHQLNIITERERERVPPRLVAQHLHNGGPVEPGRGFVLHTPDFTSDSTMTIDEGVSLTATLEILRAIATGRGPRQSLVALGYAGWSAGQLESEIIANGWLTSAAEPDLIFAQDQDTKYDKVLRRMGVDPVLLSATSGHA